MGNTTGSVASGALGGATSGAMLGAQAGTIFGLPGMAIGAAAGLVGGGLVGYLNRGKKSKGERSKEKLVDQLLKSVSGEGPYSDLFNANEQSFQKNFAEPAMRRFKTNTAEQIKQQYIAKGQHMGTGLEDALMRAGVDLDDLVNQQYMQYQQGAQNRKMQGLSMALNAPTYSDDESGWGAAGRGAMGMLGNETFQDFIAGGFKNEGENSAKPKVGSEVGRPLAQGFAT